MTFLKWEKVKATTTRWFLAVKYALHFVTCVTRVTCVTCWKGNLRLLEKSRISLSWRGGSFFSIVMCDTDKCDRCDMLNRQSELAGKMRVASFPANSFSLISKRSFNMSHMSHMSQRELRPSPPIISLSFQKGHLTCHTCLTCHKESCVLPRQYFFSHFKKVI